MAHRYVEMGYSDSAAAEAVTRFGDDLHAGCHWLMMRETMGRVPKRLKATRVHDTQTYIGSVVRYLGYTWSVCEFDAEHALVRLTRHDSSGLPGRWEHISDARMEWLEVRHDPLVTSVPKAVWRRNVGTIDVSLCHMAPEHVREITPENALHKYLSPARPPCCDGEWYTWRTLDVLTNEYIHTPARSKPRSSVSNDIHNFRVELMTYFHVMCDVFQVDRDVFNDSLYNNGDVFALFPPPARSSLRPRVEQWHAPGSYLARERRRWKRDCLPLVSFTMVTLLAGPPRIRFQVGVHDMTFVRPRGGVHVSGMFHMQHLFFTLYPKTKPEFHMPGPIDDEFFDNVLQLARKPAPASLQPSPDFVQELFPYQKRCLQWLVQRECQPVSSWGWTQHLLEDGFPYHTSVFGQVSLTPPNAAYSGGLLAQEVGMGKTWEMLALMATHKADGPTIVIVPTTMLSVWLSETHKCVPSFKVVKYHGARRTKNMDELRAADVVVTTYRVVVNETQQHVPTIGAIRWGRIVLDESHEMKGSHSATCRAICRLFAPRRWCISATPWPKGMTNAVALLTFLGVHPFVESSDDSLSSGYSFTSRGDNSSVLAELLRSVTWWQRKRHVRLKLPPVTARDVVLPLACPEIYRHLRRAIAKRVQLDHDNQHPKRRTRMLHYIRWLRQAALGYGLNRLGDYGEPGDDDQAPSEVQTIESCLNALGDEQYDQSLRTVITSCRHGDESCSICMDAMDRPTLTPCNHVFCYECIQTSYSHDPQRKCPLCRAPAGTRPLRELTEQEDAATLSAQMWRTTDAQGRSVEMSMEMYNKLLKQNQTTSSKFTTVLQMLKHNASKLIVFTQFHKAWVKMCETLRDANIGYASIEGKMSPGQRQKAIHDFQQHADTRVFIMTTKTASVGITLTAGSHVVFLEPCGDAHVRKQAIGRAWRIGQTEPVTVTTLKTDDTIDMVRQKDFIGYLHSPPTTNANEQTHPAHATTAEL